MAQVTIIIKDQENGNICIEGVFDPPLSPDTEYEDLTDAQCAALYAIQMVRGMED